MTFGTFIHSKQDSSTTLSELRRIYSLVSPTEFFGLFAYATQSGIASFDLQFGDAFWSDTPSRWLFGIDYGRTQPQALRRICGKENAEVRIVDADWVLDQTGFIPRRDFHAKLSILANLSDLRFGMVVGSGNFSSNGLRKSIEAGAAIYTDDADIYAQTISESLTIANELWEHATPADEIIPTYEELWRNSFFRAVENDQEANQDLSQRDVFWIEAGYVTKNRGAASPGNQIDFPRGMSRYFGFNPSDDLPLNSIIGEVKFLTPAGDPVSRNLRLGNNSMEKITLPIPETHGLDIYDGKILVFQRKGKRFALSALEADDFETAFGDRLSGVRVMGSGRRYGHIG